MNLFSKIVRRAIEIMENQTVGSRKVDFSTLVALCSRTTVHLNNFRLWVDERDPQTPAYHRAKTQLKQFCLQNTNNIEKIIHQLDKISNNFYVRASPTPRDEPVGPKPFRSFCACIAVFRRTVELDLILMRDIVPDSAAHERQKRDMLTALACFSTNLTKMHNFASMLKTNLYIADPTSEPAEVNANDEVLRALTDDFEVIQNDE